MAAPVYVNRWKLLRDAPQPGHQPFVARGVRMYGFVFDGGPQNVNDLCTRYFGQPRGSALSYTAPEPSWILLTFTDTRSLASQNTPYCNMGWAPEREAAFWVVVQKNDGTLLSFAPYMFVDNPVAIIQGREIYGFPKEIGWFEGFPLTDHSPTRFNVDVYGVPTFGAQARAAQYRLLDVSRTSGEIDIPTVSWNDLTAAAADLSRAALHMKPEMLFPPSVGMVFLKQAPDVHDGRLACYQAIVETRAQLSTVPHGGPLLGTYQLSLSKLDSHPIGTDLGLHPTQQAKFSYWLDVDFVFGSGVVVWKA